MEGRRNMKKLLAMGLMLLVSACASEPLPPAQPQPKETYPSGMTEQEWNELSIQDKTRIRRDFYFYEKGTISFVDPQLEIEGKKEVVPYNMRSPAAPKPIVGK